MKNIEKEFDKIKRVISMYKYKGIIPEVAKLTEQYPYRYDQVLTTWVENKEDIELTERTLQINLSKGR